MDPEAPCFSSCGVITKGTKMNRTRIIPKSLAVALAAALMMWLSPEARAQTSILVGGETALGNASGGAVGARSPGNMVDGGLSRTIDGGQIVGTGPETSIRDQLLADMITIVFDDLNSAIRLITDLLLVRAGGTPTSAGNLGDLLGSGTNTGQSGSTGDVVDNGTLPPQVDLGDVVDTTAPTLSSRGRPVRMK